ncbi:MAG: sigma-54-dependent Fis family transcriptional regulator [Alphaproteobacteria bacterium]|nr:MAG: sigma-54-dependent Fis family transcriptional regulator [Alphaproteobacteria bacterium]
MTIKQDQVVLVVDDEAMQREIVQAVLEAAGYTVVGAASGPEALMRLRAPEGPTPDLVLLDLMMPEMDGYGVLRELRPKYPALPVIVLTAESSLDTVVRVMRAGATDFIAKPASAERLTLAVENALKMNAVTGEIARGRRKWKGRITFDDLLGESEAMRRAVDLARKGAAANIPILIEGESGVGKEMFARAIQAESDRADKPFVAVNCGAIPENLVESILFGHEKGAFTGATERHEGKFVEANGGTLFLDEVGELPLDIQVKLLRAIQEGEVDPVGGRKPVKVDIRLISATNKTLLERVKEGMFREDLLYRLNVFPVPLPPLRQRREDIPLLADHFARMVANAEGRPHRPISGQAMELLQSYDWPGNVRQLENAIFRAVILADGDTLDVEDFPQILNASSKAEDYVVKTPDPSTNRVTGAPIAIFDEEGEIRPLHDLEADIIRLALKHYDGRMSEIARRLGIGRSTLYRKVAELGLDEGYPKIVSNRV